MPPQRPGSILDEIDSLLATDTASTAPQRSILDDIDAVLNEPETPPVSITSGVKPAPLPPWAPRPAVSHGPAPIVTSGTGPSMDDLVAATAETQKPTLRDRRRESVTLAEQAGITPALDPTYMPEYRGPGAKFSDPPARGPIDQLTDTLRRRRGDIALEPETDDLPARGIDDLPYGDRPARIEDIALPRDPDALRPMASHTPAASVPANVLTRQAADNSRFGGFMAKGPEVRSRTEAGRLLASERLIQDLLFDRPDGSAVVVDIGSGLGHPDPAVAGATVRDLTANQAISKKAHIVATDIASEMPATPPQGLDVATIPEDYRIPVRALADRAGRKDTVILRAANSIDLLMNPAQTQQHFTDVAEQLVDRDVFYLFNAHVLRKKPGETSFEPVGAVSGTGFVHNGRPWQAQSAEEEQYALDPDVRTMRPVVSHARTTPAPRSLPVETPGALERALTNPPRAVAAGLFRGVTSSVWGPLQAAGDILGLPSVSEWAKAAGEQASGMTAAVRGDQAGAGPNEQAIYGGFESIGLTLPALAGSVATGNPTPLLASMGVATAGESYATARAKGLDVSNALAYAASQAAIEMATEKIPASRLLADLAARTGFLKTIMSQLVTEIPGEQVATVLQDLNDWAALNPDKPFQTYLDERPSAAASTLISTVVATIGQTAGARAIERFTRTGDTMGLEPEAPAVQTGTGVPVSPIAPAAEVQPVAPLDAADTQVVAPLDAAPTVSQEIAAQRVEEAAGLRGTEADVQDNPVAQALEQERRAAADMTDEEIAAEISAALQAEADAGDTAPTTDEGPLYAVDREMYASTQSGQQHQPALLTDEAAAQSRTMAEGLNDGDLLEFADGERYAVERTKSRIYIMSLDGTVMIGEADLASDGTITQSSRPFLSTVGRSKVRRGALQRVIPEGGGSISWAEQGAGIKDQESADTRLSESGQIAMRIGNSDELQLVDSLEAAGRAHDAMIEKWERETGLGSSDWPGVTLVDPSTGAVVGHVSYNGRIWEGAPKAWTKNTKEIPRIDNRGYGKDAPIDVVAEIDQVLAADTPTTDTRKPFEDDVIHVTTPESAEGIIATGFDTRRRDGLGGDDYGPGVYLADERSDSGSFWADQLRTKHESGEVQTTALGGRAKLDRPLTLEAVSRNGRGTQTPRAMLQEAAPALVREFDAMVGQGGYPPRLAIGSLARDAGYDGLVIQHRSGQEIIAFDAKSVTFTKRDGKPLAQKRPSTPQLPPPPGSKVVLPSFATAQYSKPSLPVEEPKSKKSAKAAKTWTEIGKNTSGQTIYQDDRGVRSYVENGVRQSEAVGMRPTRGGIEITTDRTGSDQYTLAELHPAFRDDEALSKEVAETFDRAKTFAKERQEAAAALPVAPPRSAEQIIEARGYDAAGRSTKKDAPIVRETDRGSVEIKFAAKPDADTLARIKAAGYRWAKGNKVWYKKGAKIADAQKLVGADETSRPQDPKTSGLPVETASTKKGETIEYDVALPGGKRETMSLPVAPPKEKTQFDGLIGERVVIPTRAAGLPSVGTLVDAKGRVVFNDGTEIVVKPDDISGVLAYAENQAQRDENIRRALAGPESTVPLSDDLKRAAAVEREAAGVDPRVETKNDKSKRRAELAAKRAHLKTEIATAVDEIKATLKDETTKVRGGLPVPPIDLVTRTVNLARLYAQAGIVELEDGWLAFEEDFGPGFEGLRRAFEMAWARVQPGLPVEVAKVEKQAQTESQDDDATDGRNDRSDLDGAESSRGDGAESKRDADDAARGGGAPSQSGAGGRRAARPESGAGAGTGDGRGRADRERLDDDERPAGGAPGPVRIAGTGPANYRITEDDKLGAGGNATKYKQNIAAIRLAKRIHAEARPATAEEQAQLVKFVGWGGLKRELADNERQLLADGVMTSEEYHRAFQSTQNAHYTSPEIITALWQAVTDLGFTQGRVLEPSMGVGHFLGLAPADLRATQIAGVELDNLTGLIAQQLYPQSRVQVTGFQDASLPADYFDLAISNVPFGNVPVADPASKIPNYVRATIHNYFFAKALQKVRPGGLIAFITTHGTLDAQKSQAVREYIGQQADFLGAVRLPDTTFKANAGTEVVTDIVLMRRRLPGEKPRHVFKDWTTSTLTFQTTENPRGVPVNDYFLANPRRVVGKLGAEGTMYGGGGGQELSVKFTGDVAEAATDALKDLTREIITAGHAYTPAPREAATDTPDVPAEIAPDAVIEQMFYVDESGRLRQRQKGQGIAVEKHDKVLRRYIKLRDAFRQLVATMRDTEASDRDVARDRLPMAKAYDAFVKAHGPLHKASNARILLEDPYGPAVLAIEQWDADHEKATKAAIFSKRTVRAEKPPDTVDSPAHALSLSLAETGGISWPRIASLLGMEIDAAKAALVAEGRVFETPNGNYETAERYLSGRVRDKLAQAVDAAQLDDRFMANVKALEAVQPADLPEARITVQLGAPWVPIPVLERFFSHLGGRHLSAQYRPATAEWTVLSGATRSGHSGGDARQWETDRVSLEKLLHATLNNQQVIVRDREGATDAKPTLEAQTKQEAIRKEFRAWAWRDAERAQILKRLYNDTHNATVLAKYDGSHLTLPGMSDEWREKLRPHQRNAIWRAILEGNTHLAHTMGAGKTAVISAIAMEYRRMGLAKKPVIVIPKQTLSDYQKLAEIYPHARVLIGTKAQTEGDARKQFMARIATGDWDAIIITRDAMVRMPAGDAAWAEYLEEQIAELRAAASEEDLKRLEAGQKKGRLSDLAKKIERLEQRLEEKRKSIEGRKDQGLAWEDLGVDMILADEAHAYRKMTLATQLDAVAGVPTGDGSQRADDLFIKAREISKRTPGRNLVFGTGTPLVNSVAELYILQRFLQPEALRLAGVEKFDAWAATFGNIVTKYEADITGTRLKTKRRFAEFTNMNGLIQMFRSVMDVMLPEDLNLPTPPIAGGQARVHTIDAGEELSAFIASLAKRVKELKPQDRKSDNMLKISTDGRKAALDLRLVGRSGGHKLEAIAEQVLKTHEEWNARKGTQLVFMEMGVPGGETFSTYEALKALLVKGGIPAKQIAFIQDANTDIKRDTLMAKMRSGEIRVMLGARETMGTGVNVQSRLVRLHHADPHWLPALIEQADGRGIRQGNLFFMHGSPERIEGFELGIDHYVVKGSFDAFMWQSVAWKGKMINQALRGNLQLDSIEDIGGGAVFNAAEIAAIATGNPIMMERMNLEQKIAQLQVMADAHDRTTRDRRHDRATLPERIAAATTELGLLEAARAVFTAEPAITIAGKAVTDLDEANKQVRELLGDVNTVADAEKLPGALVSTHLGNAVVVVPVGTLGGMPMAAVYEFNSKDEVASAVISTDIKGTRAIRSSSVKLAPVERMIEHVRTVLPDRIKSRTEERDAAEKNLAEAERNKDAAFPDQAELDAAKARLAEINTELGKGESDQVVADDSKDDEDDDRPDVDGMPLSRGGPRTPIRVVRNQAPRVPRPLGHATPESAKASTATPHLRPEQIIRRLRELFDVPVRDGAKGRLGAFFAKARLIRTRISKDLPVLAHEFGHVFEREHNTLILKDPRWDAELTHLGQATAKASDSVAQVRREGLAEFFRLWLLEPASAQQVAPNFYQAFGPALSALPIGKELLAIQKDATAYAQSDPVARVALKIDFDGTRSNAPSPVKNPKEWTAAMATTYVDDLARLKHAVEAMAGGNPLPADLNAYVLGRVARGSAGRAQSFLEDGVRDSAGQWIGGGIADAIKPVADELETFAVYLVAKRATELHARAKETGLSDAEANLAVKEVESRPDAARFLEAARRVYAFNKAMHEYARLSGVFSAEQVTAMEALNQYYVPFQRVMDAAGADASGQGTSRKMADRTVPVFRLKGSGRDIVNPLESLIANTFAMVDMVEKNRAAQALVAQADASADSARWLEQVAAPQKVQSINVQEVLEAYFGPNSPEMADIQSTVGLSGDELVTLFQPAWKGDKGKQMLTVIRDGQRVFYQVQDAQLYTALTQIGIPLGSAPKIARMFVSLLRAGATLTPGFVLRNPARDTVVAGIQSRHGFIPVYDTARGLAKVVLHELGVRTDEDVRLFYASGAAQAALVGADRDRARQAIKKLADPKAFLRSVIKNPIELMRALSEFTETATRVGEFSNALNMGGRTGGLWARATGQRQITATSLAVAALAARDVTTDFSRGGTFTREANNYSAFFNARVQGYARMGETAARVAKGDLNPLVTPAGMVLVSLILAALQGDDEEYTELPEWERIAYWHLNLKYVGGPDKFLRIAKPFEYALIPNAAEAAFTYAQDKNPDATRLLRAQVKDSARQLVMGVVPSILLPVLEVEMNYSMFRQRNIVSPWNTDLPLEMQANDYTTETAKLLSRTIPLAPAHIDHMLFGYTAGVGRGVVEYGVDPGLAAVGIVPPARERPARTTQQLPVVGVFMRDTALDSNAPTLVEFHEAYREMQGANRGLKIASQDNNQALARRLVDRYRGAPWMGPDHSVDMKLAKKHIDNVADQVDGIYAAPPDKLTPAQKRELLNAKAREMTAWAKFGLGRGPRPN